MYFANRSDLRGHCVPREAGKACHKSVSASTCLYEARAAAGIAQPLQGLKSFFPAAGN